jgi:hypothetical protein
MTHLNESLIHSLRCMARRGTAPSQMLRELVSSLAPDTPDRQALVRYFTEAFCFTEGQAYPIFGWLPDSSGQLKDADLDYLLTKRIGQTRADWDAQAELP